VFDPSGWQFVGGDEAEKKFFDGLGATADQKKAIAALRENADFKKLWDYLRKSEVRIVLEARPGLKIRGVERFGGFSGDPDAPLGQLILNPTKKEHKDNPIELVDTLVHESIHAAIYVRTKDRTTPYPLDEKIKDIQSDPKLAGLESLKKKDAKITGDAQLKDYLDKNYGDGQSDPENEYIDINIDAQKFVARILDDVLAKAKVGNKGLTHKGLDKLKKARGD